MNEAVTTADLAAELGAPSTDAQLQPSLAEAREILAAELGRAAATVPPATARRLVLEVASNLYNRRGELAGTSTFAGYDGATPVRQPRDPLATVRPLLRTYTAPPIG